MTTTWTKELPKEAKRNLAGRRFGNRTAGAVGHRVEASV
jgi:hypothetical protein